MRRVLVLIAAAGVVALLLWMQGEDDGRIERRGLPTSAVDEGRRDIESSAETKDPETVAAPTDDDDPRRIPGPDVVLIGRVERNGERVPNAGIEARRYDESIAIAEARTDGDGAFRLNFARRTKLVLTARDDEGRCATVLAFVPDKGNPDEVIIQLKDAHPFGGIILNPDGTPHAGAVVRLSTETGWYAYSTDSGVDGRFAFPHVHPGDYEVRIAARGFPVIRRITTVPGLRDLKATLFAGGSIRGSLRDDLERPIGGATITLHSGDGRKSPAGIATVVTQADGSFRMPDVMPGPCWSASVSHPEWGCLLSRSDEVALPIDPVRPGEESVWDITLRSATILVIRVVAEESRAPIEGALISVAPVAIYEPDQCRRKRTDESGVVAFPHASPDRVVVRIEHPYRMIRSGDDLAERRPVWSHQWKTGEVTLVCAHTGMVEGQLHRGHATDYSVVSLVLGPQEKLWSQVDGTGRFRILGVPEARDAVILGHRTQVRSRPFDVVAGKRTWIDVDIPFIPAMTGVVLDAQRDPVAGAKVRLVPTSEIEAVIRRTGRDQVRWEWAETTNQRGEFAIFSAKAIGSPKEETGKGGDWSLAVIHPDFRPLRKDGLDPPNEEAPQSITVELRSGESIEGTVRFATGQPAPNIPVEALPEGTSPDDQAPRRVMSDSNGKFTLRGLKAGTWALKALHGEGVSRPVSVRAGASDVRITIEMHPPILGLLLDDEERPLAGALVELERSRQPTLTTRTEPNGRFRLEHVAPGPHRLKVRPLQWMTTKGLRGCAHFPRFESDPVEAGGDPVVLRAERGSVLTGRVLDAAGNAVPRATIVADIGDGWIVIANAEGEFAIKGAGEDPVTVYATGSGQPIRAIELLPGRGLTEIRLPRGESIRGRVLDAAGQPAKGAVVRVTPEVDTLTSATELSHELAGVLRLDARRTAVTGNDGTFLIRDIEAGAYTAETQREDGASCSARVQTDGPSIDLQLPR